METIVMIGKVLFLRCKAKYGTGYYRIAMVVCEQRPDRVFGETSWASHVSEDLFYSKWMISKVMAVNALAAFVATTLVSNLCINFEYITFILIYGMQGASDSICIYFLSMFENQFFTLLYDYYTSAIMFCPCTGSSVYIFTWCHKDAANIIDFWMHG